MKVSDRKHSKRLSAKNKRVRVDQKYAEIMRPPQTSFREASVFVSVFDTALFFVGIGRGGARVQRNLTRGTETSSRRANRSRHILGDELR